MIKLYSPVGNIVRVLPSRVVYMLTKGYTIGVQDVN